jgi:hypothetical protein
MHTKMFSGIDLNSFPIIAQKYSPGVNTTLTKIPSSQANSGTFKQVIPVGSS